MKMSRSVGLGACVLTLFVVWGCAESLFFLGRGTLSGVTPGTTATSSGGITTLGGDVPTTTQPAAVPGPSYAPSLLDPLYEATAGAKAVAIGDINNDGILDAASISDENQPVQIHLRDGPTGTFTTIPIGGGGPLARTVRVELADFNSDGLMDVAVCVNDTSFFVPPPADREGAFVILLQGADVRNPYAWTRVTPVNGRIGCDALSFQDMVVADFDGQNGPDVAVLANEPTAGGTKIRNLYLFPNPGPALAADQTAWMRFSLFLDFTDFLRCETADVDLDGDQDIVMCSPEAKSFNLRWMTNPLVEAGVGAVTAGAWTRRFIGQQQDGANLIAVGDIDGDGAVDVAASRVDLAQTQWFRNPGPAALAAEVFPIPWEVYNIGSLNSGQINQVRLVDLDLNGTLDCFIAASGNVVGFQRQPSNLFDFWTPFSIFATEPVAEIGRPAFSDFNLDGQLDFVLPLDRDGLTMDQLVIFTRQ